MTAENFTLEQGYALVVEGKTFDLHNNYDFIRFSYSSTKSEVVLLWRRSKGDWVEPDAPTFIKIVFSGTTFLKTVYEAGDDVSPTSTLEFAGYLRTDDVPTMNGYLERTEIAGDYHLIFGFDGGMAIKLRAASGMAETLQAIDESEL